METKFDNCSRLYLNDSNFTEGILDINTVTCLSFAITCITLLRIYHVQELRIKAAKIKHDGSSQSCLGFGDLPAVKARIPIKLIGNLFQLFPFDESLKVVQKWSNEYGDLFTCIGLNQRFVILNSGPTIQAMLKSSDFGHGMKAPIMYDPMKPFITNGVLVSKGLFWKRQRKTLMKTQSFLSLKSHIPMIERHSRRLVHDLEKLFEDGQCHEINGYLNTTFIGIITEVITGKKLDDLHELEDYHRNFSIWKEVLFKRVINPFLHLEPIWMLHALYKPYKNALAGLSDFARRRILEHKLAASKDKEENSEKESIPTMLDELIKTGVEETQIIDEINTMMFGGHETGACAIHFLCLCLALNPQIQKLAQTEVDLFFEDSSNSVDGMFTYESVQKCLKYLERCILEALRLFPPVFVISRKLETPLKIEYKGRPVLIPKGVNIVISPLALHRREKLFPNPERFDPDRFTSEECAKRHAYSFIPFSSGPRNCLGQKFAMVELKIIAAYILRHFELSSTDKLEDVKLLPYTTLTPKSNFTFALKKRSF